MKPYIVGADLGGTTVKIGLFTVDELLEKWEIPTRTEENGKYILSDIAESILKELKERKISKEEVQGVGIDVPGAVLPDGTVNRAVNLGWGVLKAGPVLSELLGGIPVEVANDANAAALGEMWKGGGQGFHDVMMVTLGTGVGGGVILNGRIRTGAFGAAGEIGHMCMNPKETAVCGCGKKGCLEQYTSANGVARCAKKFLVENPKAKTTLRGIPNISSKDVFDGAKAGDYVCHQLVDEFGEMLGHGLANIASVIDPEIFVIGGGLSKAGQIVIDATKKFYLQYTFHASRETKFALASLGNDAGMYGCVKMVIDAAPDQVKEDPEE